MRLAAALIVLLIAVPVAAQDDGASLALSITYAAAVGADIGSTVACTSTGGCHEQNPLYGSAKGWQFGAARAAIGAGTLYAVHRWTRPRTWQRYAALGLLVVGQGAVVAWNVRQR